MRSLQGVCRVPIHCAAASEANQQMVVEEEQAGSLLEICVISCVCAVCPQSTTPSTISENGHQRTKSSIEVLSGEFLVALCDPLVLLFAVFVSLSTLLFASWWYCSSR